LYVLFPFCESHEVIIVDKSSGCFVDSETRAAVTLKHDRLISKQSKRKMIFFWLFITGFAKEASSNHELRSTRRRGVTQMHLAYLGENERSVSWTSLTEKDPMTLLYQLAVPGPDGEIKQVDSKVKTFIEPQDKDQKRYIHTVILR
jgi:hypothetical protein